MLPYDPHSGRSASCHYRTEVCDLDICHCVPLLCYCRTTWMRLVSIRQSPAERGWERSCNTHWHTKRWNDDIRSTRSDQVRVDFHGYPASTASHRVEYDRCRRSTVEPHRSTRGEYTSARSIDSLLHFEWERWYQRWGERRQGSREFGSDSFVYEERSIGRWTAVRGESIRYSPEERSTRLVIDVLDWRDRSTIDAE